MPLGMEVGLTPGDFVLYKTQLPSPKRGWSPSPQFSAHICCGQTAGWIKMPLGMEVGLGPNDFVLNGDPAPPAKKGAEPPIFGPCLLWSNGWVDQDGTWYGGRPRPRRHCVTWEPRSPPKRTPPIFGPCLLWPAVCIRIPLGTEVSLSVGDIVLDGDLAPLPKKGQSPPIFGPFLLWPKRLDASGGGVEVGLSPGDFVLNGDPAPLPKKAAEPPIFGPCLLWPNGWMDQGAT